MNLLSLVCILMLFESIIAFLFRLVHLSGAAFTNAAAATHCCHRFYIEMTISITITNKFSVCISIAGMTDKGEVLKHPFVITTPLTHEFGYPKAFSSMKLAWEFDDSTTASAGGGRLSDDGVKKLVAALGEGTREGESLKLRQMQLKTIFSNHYDAPRIQFLLQFFLEDLAKPNLNKTDAIAMLVENGVPFIPWPLLQDHLVQGAAKGKTKKPLPALDWGTEYTVFCEANKPPSLGPSPDDAGNSVKLAKALSFWETALGTHNKGLKPSKQVRFTDTDTHSFTGSQFSLSDGGTPHISKTSTLDQSLRDKLAVIKSSSEDRERQKLAADLKRQLLELEQADEAKRASSKKSHKRRHNSDSDSDSEQGFSALDVFLKEMRDKIENSSYIDFASLSTSRLSEIKMLNASSSKTTRIQANLTFRHTLSEADVQVLSEDLGSIFDGFFYHYLSMVNDSHLDLPVKKVFDRIRWWQWISSNFAGNPAAQVMFIKRFMVDHHAEDLWEPVVKNSHTLVAFCKEKCAPFTHAPQRPPPPPRIAKLLAPGGSVKGGKGGRKTSYSPAQLAKLAILKGRFPGVCLSRVIKGRSCLQEDKGAACRYTHTCAWCNTAACRATCALTEAF